MLKTSIWVGKICQSWRAKLEGKIWTVDLGHDWTNNSCLQIEHVRLLTFAPVSRQKTYWWEHKQGEQCVKNCMWNHARLQHSARNRATSPKNLGLKLILKASSMYLAACIACGFLIDVTLLSGNLSCPLDCGKCSGWKPHVQNNKLFFCFWLVPNQTFQNVLNVKIVPNAKIEPT